MASLTGPKQKASVQDIFLRREFAKAVAHKTKKKFDEMTSRDLREVFDSIDTAGDGYLTLDELRALLLCMDENTPEEIVIGILNSLDIDSSGSIEFAEFCQIFGSKSSKQRER
jgi:Ca2+-binding EF-hand superfamily protein